MRTKKDIRREIEAAEKRVSRAAYDLAANQYAGLWNSSLVYENLVELEMAEKELADLKKENKNG